MHVRHFEEESSARSAKVQGYGVCTVWYGCVSGADGLSGLRRAGNATEITPAPADEAVMLLAEANLLRTWGQHRRDDRVCTRILRLDPNGSTHSLLGDLYRDEGNYREALGWYKQAVNINATTIPTSANWTI